MSRGVAVVTGTTHGIGRVTARELARAGFTVAMLCRDVPAAANVRDAIVAQLPFADVRVIECDLASLASVRSAAAAVHNEFAAIRLLINNAGMVSARHRMSRDGFELTFASNYLGPFLLTALLTPRLEAGGRIVTVASSAHYRGVLDFEGIANPRSRYSGIAAYARSKLANILHTFALARRFIGRPVTVNCLHPGVVATNLLPRWLRIVKPLFTAATFDAERGARTTLHLALSPAVAGESGRYFDEHQREKAASTSARDVDLQERLWAASERWTGIRSL